MATPTPPRASLNGPSYQVVKFQAGRPNAVPTITAGSNLINALFQGEQLTGVQVFNGAAANAKLDSFDLAAGKKVTLKIAVATDRTNTYNVMAMLEGRDPALRREYVVMSAHLDHVGLANPNADGDGINNGADDDASGCVALMGMAKAYATGVARGIRPKRTIIFLWVAGEEKGLWGSRYFNQFPPVDITKVVANLNMDMVGRSKTPGYVDPPSYKLAEPNEVFVVGPRIASADLGRTVADVNSRYLKMKINDFYDTVVPDDTHDNLGPGTSGQDLLPQRPLQFREDGDPDCVLLRRPPFRLSPRDRQRGEDRLRQARSCDEDGLCGQLGPRQLGHAPEAERETARTAARRHEDREGAGLGPADADQVTAGGLRPGAASRVSRPRGAGRQPARLKFWRPPAETLMWEASLMTGPPADKDLDDPTLVIPRTEARRPDPAVNRSCPRSSSTTATKSSASTA